MIYFKKNNFKNNSSVASLKNLGSLSFLMLIILVVQASEITVVKNFENTPLEGYDIRLWLWLGCYVFAVTAMVYESRFKWLIWLLRRNRLVVFIIGTAFLSTIWSIDPETSLKRSTHLVGTCLVCVFVISHISAEKIVLVVSQVLLAVLVLNSLFCISNPSIGIVLHEGQLVWQGLTSNKNNLGLVAAISIYLGVVYQLSNWKSKPILSGGLIVIGLGILWKTQSMTSLLCVVAGAGTVLLYIFLKRYRISYGVLYLIAIPAFIIILIIVSLFEANVGDFTKLIGKSETFTGRAPLWLEAWNVTLDRPILGHGYGTIWNPHSEYALELHQTILAIDWEEPISSAHNGFLQLSNEIGLVTTGAAFILIVHIFVVHTAQYLGNQRDKSMVVAPFCVLLFVHNTAETTLFRSHELLWLLFLLLIFRCTYDKLELANPKRKISGRKHSSQRRRRKSSKRKRSGINRQLTSSTDNQRQLL